MSSVEPLFRSTYFLILVAFMLGFAQIMMPSGNSFFSGKFLVILLGGALGALWATAKVRAQGGDVPVAVYPLLVVVMIVIACTAKYLVTRIT